MKLYLIQHGAAKLETEDQERSLTSTEENEVARVAQAAKRYVLDRRGDNGWALRWILTSKMM
jgi:phosphohistidine phosphatase SixA